MSLETGLQCLKPDIAFQQPHTEHVVPNGLIQTADFFRREFDSNHSQFLQLFDALYASINIALQD